MYWHTPGFQLILVQNKVRLPGNAHALTCKCLWLVFLKKKEHRQLTLTDSERKRDVTIFHRKWDWLKLLWNLQLVLPYDQTATSAIRKKYFSGKNEALTSKSSKQPFICHTYWVMHSESQGSAGASHNMVMQGDILDNSPVHCRPT